MKSAAASNSPLSHPVNCICKLQVEDKKLRQDRVDELKTQDVVGWPRYTRYELLVVLGDTNNVSTSTVSTLVLRRTGKSSCFKHPTVCSLDGCPCKTIVRELVGLRNGAKETSLFDDEAR